ncbi:MAG: hypothetical protein WCS94_14150 [Verrucomicrobiota bacterium]
MYGSCSMAGRGYVAIATGKCNGRSVWQGLMDGRITVSGTDNRGKKFLRVVECVGGEIMDNSLRSLREGNGKKSMQLVHRIAYGRFEVKRENGRRTMVNFKKGTGTSRHGKSRRWERLFGHDGVCHSWFNRGRLVRQQFIYDNGKQAYNWLATGRTGKATVRNYYGKEMYCIEGALDGCQQWEGHSIFARPMLSWFLHSSPFKVFKYGREVYSGQYRNSQKVGRWVETEVKRGRTLVQTFAGDSLVARQQLRKKTAPVEVFYEHGVAIPKKLYETPAEQLDPKALFKIDNAQLRMALLSRIKPERLAQVGRVIHKQRDMRLYHVPGMEVRILKVVCPSTKSVYHIRVPLDSEKCEEARQWTFHVNAGVRQPIKFAQET